MVLLVLVVLLVVVFREGTATTVITTEEEEGGIRVEGGREGGRLCIWRRAGAGEEEVIRVLMGREGRFRRGACRKWVSRWVG